MVLFRFIFSIHVILNDLVDLNAVCNIYFYQILRSDPMETEEAVLRLPPFPVIKPSEA